VDAHLGFALANAGGSDSTPTCANLVVFDPTLGTIRQVVNLATPYATGGPLYDSAGAPVPGGSFTQSGAEGVAYRPGEGGGPGIVLVAMSNLVFGAPSYGAVKDPGTVEVFDVDPAAALPVTPRAALGLATQTIATTDYNPVAVTLLDNPTGPKRILV